MQVYLDNSATTKILPDVVESMVKTMEENFGNPSSMHRLGFESEKLLKEARKTLLKALKVEGTHNLIFTSGGTEADNLAIIGTALRNARRGRKIITSAIEHPAVLESVKYLERQGFEIIYLPVDSRGIISLQTLKKSLTGDVILVSVMRANNETGCMEPIEQIRELVNKSGAFFHTDVIQSFGKTEDNLGDLIAVSGHKIGGPKGIGALAYRKDIKLEPLIYGGGQEFSLRSGTENLPAVAGLKKAVEHIDVKRFQNRVKTLKERLLKGIEENIKDIVINSPEEVDCLVNILNISFLNTRSEVILHSLETKGVYVSSGSACNSKNTKGSHVLKAMGRRDREIQSAIRFSLCEFTTESEIDYAVEAVIESVDAFRKLRSIR